MTTKQWLLELLYKHREVTKSIRHIDDDGSDLESRYSDAIRLVEQSQEDPNR